MSAAGDYKKIQKITSIFKDKLAAFSEETFLKRPATGGWSYSEVYFHIFDASLLTLDTIADCSRGKGEEGRTPLISKIILFFDTLPPGQKYKAPKRLAERLKTISRAEAAELIQQFLSKLAAVYRGLHEAGKIIKTAHPRLGFFNAYQWFRFLEIHLAHHLKQVIRIEKSF